MEQAKRSNGSTFVKHAPPENKNHPRGWFLFSDALYVPTKNPSACGMGVARRTQPETEKVGATLGFRVPEVTLPPLVGGFCFLTAPRRLGEPSVVRSTKGASRTCAERSIIGWSSGCKRRRLVSRQAHATVPKLNCCFVMFGKTG